jgi:hypothetical protein
MIYIIIAVAIARALQSFDLPDFKPLNCLSCLSFWTAVAIYLFVDYRMIPMAFVSYLLSDLILLYESKR